MDNPTSLDNTQPVNIPPIPEETPPETADTGVTVPLSLQNTVPVEAQDYVESFGAPMYAQGEESNYPPGAGMPAGSKKRLPRWAWLMLAILVLFLAAVVSSFSGYRAGIRERLAAQALQIAQGLSTQFQLALQDMDAGRYELAVQRFEYIIQNDPTFPGVIDKMTQAKMALGTTATPTAAPVYTPAPSPTPDTRGEEEMFSSAKGALDAKDWPTAIDMLLNLRKVNPEFKAARVDGMLYVAFRNRGAQKILQQADLEGGTYDLSLAEKFGPLDVEASNYRTWVNLYVTGASFWELDWKQAAYYFGQVAPLAPNLRDSSGWTASQRYQIALSSYGDALAEQEDYCAAEEQYNLALSYGVAIQPTVEYAHNICSPPTAVPPPAEATPEPTATP